MALTGGWGVHILFAHLKLCGFSDVDLIGPQGEK